MKYVKGHFTGIHRWSLILYERLIGKKFCLCSFMWSLFFVRLRHWCILDARNVYLNKPFLFWFQFLKRRKPRAEDIWRTSGVTLQKVMQSYIASWPTVCLYLLTCQYDTVLCPQILWECGVAAVTLSPHELEKKSERPRSHVWESRPLIHSRDSASARFRQVFPPTLSSTFDNLITVLSLKEKGIPLFRKYMWRNHRHDKGQLLTYAENYSEPGNQSAGLLRNKV